MRNSEIDEKNIKNDNNFKIKSIRSVKTSPRLERVKSNKKEETTNENSTFENLNDNIKTKYMNTDFTDALPTALMHPLSGSGSRAMMIDSMKTFGADSFVGRLSCVFQACSDTILYVLALYFGSVNIKNTRYTLVAGLFADFPGV
jgi:hypothetical protein